MLGAAEARSSSPARCARPCSAEAATQAVQQAAARVLRAARPGRADPRRRAAARTDHGAQAELRAAGFDRRMVAELWTYPDGSRILELSTKCEPAEAFDVAAEARAFLAGRGIDHDRRTADQDQDRARVLRARAARHREEETPSTDDQPRRRAEATRPPTPWRSSAGWRTHWSRRSRSASRSPESASWCRTMPRSRSSTSATRTARRSSSSSSGAGGQHEDDVGGRVAGRSLTSASLAGSASPSARPPSRPARR